MFFPYDVLYRWNIKWDFAAKIIDDSVSVCSRNGYLIIVSGWNNFVCHALDFKSVKKVLVIVDSSLDHKKQIPCNVNKQWFVCSCYYFCKSHCRLSILLHVDCNSRGFLSIGRHVTFVYQRIQFVSTTLYQSINSKKSIKKRSGLNSVVHHFH